MTFLAEDDGEPSYRVAHHLTLTVRKGSMLHVDADAGVGGDGLTWATAFQDVQSALDAAATINTDAVPENYVDQIWIAEGTYLPTAELEPGTARTAAFSLIDGVTLYGGFAGTEMTLEDRGGDPAEHEAILSGDLGVVGDNADNAATVVYCGEGIEAGLDRLTITGGNADLGWTSSHPERKSGGGIYNAGAIEMTNCRAQNNRADHHGGGAYTTGDIRVASSDFANNQTQVDAAGVYNEGYARFVETLFYGNSSGLNSWGGAIQNHYGTLEIVSGFFVANQAARGGGIGQLGGDVTVINSRFVANTASQRGGGVYIASHVGTTSIANSTFAGNTATDVGGGFCADDSRRPCLLNSIVADNDAAYNPDVRAVLSADSGRNLVGTDPFFTRNPSPGPDGKWGTEDDDFGDLRLTASSPAIDFGLDDALPGGLTEDMAGNPRVYGEHVDLGAYEYQGSSTEGRDTPSNVVDTNEDTLDFYDGTTSLREALFYAEGGDPVFSTVYFDESLDGATISLGGSALSLAPSIHIDASALDSLTIDAGGLSRAFVVAGETTAVTIENLDITGGYAENGGAIYHSGAALSLLDCSLFGNEATMQGSGVYAASGSLVIEDSIVTDNAGPFAVHAADVEFTLRGTHVSNNAGGLRVSGTTVIEDSTFAENTDSAIRVDDGNVIVTGCRFEENEASYGASAYLSAGILNVVDSLFLHNSAQNGGSAIYNASGTLYARGSTFSRNTQTSVRNSGAAIITNCTFVDNPGGLGAVYGNGSASQTTVNNSLFARNGDWAGGHHVLCHSGTFVGSNNLIDRAAPACVFADGVEGNIVGTTENPVDPLLGNFTQFENGRCGYYLLAGSPALNAGDNTLAVDASGESVTTDVAGGPRILDSIVDIGAVEGSTAPNPAQTYVVTSLDNVIDSDDGELTFAEAFEAAGRNQPVGDAPAGSFAAPDTIRFAEGVTGTISLDGETLKPLGDLRIEGPGADRLTFDAGGLSRVFEIEPAISVTLSGASVSGGFSEGDGGGHSQ